MYGDPGISVKYCTTTNIWPPRQMELPFWGQPNPQSLWSIPRSHPARGSFNFIFSRNIFGAALGTAALQPYPNIMPSHLLQSLSVEKISSFAAWAKRVVYNGFKERRWNSNSLVAISAFGTPNLKLTLSKNLPRGPSVGTRSFNNLASTLLQDHLPCSV